MALEKWLAATSVGLFAMFVGEMISIYNFTEDAHPIHLHLVRFEVIARTPIGQPVVHGAGVTATEAGYKDTVIAYPGEITTVRSKFGSRRASERPTGKVSLGLDPVS